MSTSTREHFIRGQKPLVSSTNGVQHRSQMCPECSQRVAVGVQCAACYRWRHNKLPCTDPSECTVLNTPYLCPPCLKVLHRIESLGRSFPSLESKSAWTQLEANSPIKRRMSAYFKKLNDSGAEELTPLSDASHHNTLRLRTLRAYVRTQRARDVSVQFELDEPQRFLSIVEAVVLRAGDREENVAVSEPSAEESDLDVENKPHDGNAEEHHLCKYYTRRYYNADAQKKRKFRLLRINGDNSSTSASGASTSDSGSTSPSTDDGCNGDGVQVEGDGDEFDDEIDFAEVYDALIAKDVSSGGDPAAIMIKPLGAYADPRKSMQYILKGNNVESIKDHFENISMTAETEEMRRHRARIRKEQLLREAMQRKKELRQKYQDEANKARRGKLSAVDKQSEEDNKLDIGKSMTIKQFGDAHQKMYFRNLPAPIKRRNEAADEAAAAAEIARSRSVSPGVSLTAFPTGSFASAGVRPASKYARVFARDIVRPKSGAVMRLSAIEEIGCGREADEEIVDESLQDAPDDAQHDAGPVLESDDELERSHDNDDFGGFELSTNWRAPF